MYILKNTFLSLSLFVSSIALGMDDEHDINRHNEPYIEIIKIGNKTVTIVGVNGKKIKVSLPESGKSGVNIKEECQKALKTKDSVEILDQGRTLANHLSYTKDDFGNRKLIFVIKHQEERRADSACCCLNNCSIL